VRHDLVLRWATRITLLRIVPGHEAALSLQRTEHLIYGAVRESLRKQALPQLRKAEKTRRLWRRLRRSSFASLEKMFDGIEDGTIFDASERGDLLSQGEQISLCLNGAEFAVEVSLPGNRPAVLEVPTVDVVKGLIPMIRVSGCKADRDNAIPLPKKNDIPRLNCLLEPTDTAGARTRNPACFDPFSILGVVVFARSARSEKHHVVVKEQVVVVSAGLATGDLPHVHVFCSSLIGSSPRIKPSPSDILDFSLLAAYRRISDRCPGGAVIQ
jgi:hypothetical protein